MDPKANFSNNIPFYLILNIKTKYKFLQSIIFTYTYYNKIGNNLNQISLTINEKTNVFL